MMKKTNTELFLLKKFLQIKYFVHHQKWDKMKGKIKFRPHRKREKTFAKLKCSSFWNVVWESKLKFLGNFFQMETFSFSSLQKFRPKYNLIEKRMDTNFRNKSNYLRFKIFLLDCPSFYLSQIWSLSLEFLILFTIRIFFNFLHW